MPALLDLDRTEQQLLKEVTGMTYAEAVRVQVLAVYKLQQTDMNLMPCEYCGYPFDQELLGRYGCPNCEGGQESFG